MGVAAAGAGRLVLSVPALEAAIYERAETIWPKYSDGPLPSTEHDEFAAAVIATFDQHVHETEGSATDVLRAAARSLATNGRSWTRIRADLNPAALAATLKRPINDDDLERRDHVAGLIGDMAPAALTIDEWAERLSDPQYQHLLAAVLGGGDTAKEDAAGMATWAQLLRDHPDYYHQGIAYARDAFHAADETLSPESSFLCVAIYFSKEEPFAGSRCAISRPPGTRKWPRMGLPLACEFLRNLGWNGFKPDRHIVRLLGGWWVDAAPGAEASMHQIERLVGISPRTPHPYLPQSWDEYPSLRGQLICALTGVAVTPDDNYTLADNLLWLLASEVEKKPLWRRTGVDRLPSRYFA